MTVSSLVLGYHYNINILPILGRHIFWLFCFVICFFTISPEYMTGIIIYGYHSILYCFCFNQADAAKVDYRSQWEL